MLKYLNNLRLNKLITENLTDILNSNKEKKTYIIIFFLVILTIFTIDFTSKNISNSQLINKEIFAANEDMFALKNYIIKNIKSPFANITTESVFIGLKDTLCNYHVKISFNR